MSEVKHTPGPWTWDVEHPDPDKARMRSPDPVIGIYPKSGRIIAVIDTHPNHNENEIIPNTKLIAAAPEMLELIQWITRVTNNPEIGIKCDAVIKKATL